MDFPTSLFYNILWHDKNFISYEKSSLDIPIMGEFIVLLCGSFHPPQNHVERKA